MPNSACILSGGGSRGAFEAGVLSQLNASGLSFDSIYGTSAGALNAVGYSFMSAPKLYDLWSQDIKSIDDVFGKKFLLTALFQLLFGKGKGYYTMAPLARLLTRIVNINKPRIPATVCYVSLLTEAQVYTTAYPNIVYDQSAFIKAAIASAATPVLNDLVDDEFCDGGLRHITPINKAISDGATDLHIILAEPYEQNDRWTTKPANFIDTGMRAISALVQEIFWRDIQDATSSGLPVTIYAPLVNLPDPLNFTHTNIATLLQTGLNAKPVYTANQK